MWHHCDLWFRSRSAKQARAGRAQERLESLKSEWSCWNSVQELPTCKSIIFTEQIDAMVRRRWSSRYIAYNNNPTKFERYKTIFLQSLNPVRSYVTGTLVRKNNNPKSHWNWYWMGKINCICHAKFKISLRSTVKVCTFPFPWQPASRPDQHWAKNRLKTLFHTTRADRTGGRLISINTNEVYQGGTTIWHIFDKTVDCNHNF